jgi:hypothetical protein
MAFAGVQVERVVRVQPRHGLSPALSCLEEVDYASVAVEGTKKRPSIMFGERMTRLHEDSPITGSPSDAADDALPARGRGSRYAGRSDELRAATDALRGVLRECRLAGVDEQRRIATILANTVAAIRQLPEA